MIIISVLDEGEIAAQVAVEEADATATIERLNDAQQYAFDNDNADPDVPLTFDVGPTMDLDQAVEFIRKGEL